MKHLRIALICLALTGACLSPAVLSESSLEIAVLPIQIEQRETLGPAVIQDKNDPEITHECFIRYPELVSDDPAYGPALEKINQAILEKAHIREYEAMLPAFQMGSMGLRMDYELGLSDDHAAGEGRKIYDRYISILFSARGKMLSGRPGQIYYPMTFDLITGEEITFDQVFADPEGGKAFIETYLMEVVGPTLSTYLENSDLLPVPFDRFFLDSFGRVNFYYESNQLSFLSGFAGAVSFRYAELKDYLDFSDAGVVSHMGYLNAQKYMTEEEKRENALNLLSGGALVFSFQDGITPGESLQAALQDVHPASDPDYYPGGACLELEEAEYRGCLILTDEAEEQVTGLLSSRFSLYDLETGFTSLTDAAAFLGRDPVISLPLDETAAGMYRVCPGQMAVYSLQRMDNEPLTLTLYADEKGIVQYVSVEIE